MDYFVSIFNFLFHIDVYLGEMIIQHGFLSYGIIFGIIFAETGLVIAPFLPGDSLLFAAGMFSSLGSFNLYLLLFLLWLAAVLGDTLNYWIGYHLGDKVLRNPRIPINQKHIDKTNEFYAKHGGKTIILARFIPIVRTFAPFVAGVGKMNYRKFLFYNIIGGFIWIFSFVLLGFFLGNILLVRENFSIIIIVIILVSVIPIISGLVRDFFQKSKEQNKTNH
jgi:membrane-associated protein